MKIVNKAWGTEHWVVNEALYCLKYLTIRPGNQCSLHSHVLKTETFVVVKGRCILEVEANGQLTQIKMHRGSQYTIKPGTFHRFSLSARASEPCIITEVSTHHEDSDTVRKVGEDSRPCVRKESF